MTGPFYMYRKCRVSLIHNGTCCPRQMQARKAGKNINLRTEPLQPFNAKIEAFPRYPDPLQLLRRQTTAAEKGEKLRQGRKMKLDGYSPIQLLLQNRFGFLRWPSLRTRQRTSADLCVAAQRACPLRPILFQKN